MVCRAPIVVNGQIDSHGVAGDDSRDFSRVHAGCAARSPKRSGLADDSREIGRLIGALCMVCCGEKSGVWET